MRAERSPERSVHWLDRVLPLVSRRRLFTAGWGDEEVLVRVPDIARFDGPSVAAEITWGPSRREGRVVVTAGTFPARFAGLPPCARHAVVHRIAPAAPERGRRRPVYVVLPASGDEGFGARTRLWRPLAESAGIEVVFLESAMYGTRRPPGQRGPSIRRVSEHLLMNLSTIEEARALVEHLVDDGYDRVGLAGFSMGGSSAALAAAVIARPLAVAVLAAGQSVVPVFTEGLLSRCIQLAALGGAGAAHARLAALFGAADLDRHPPPQRRDAVVIVGARRDGYVFVEQVDALHALWPESELRWLDTGHAGAFLHHGDALRRAAVDAMARLSPR